MIKFSYCSIVCLHNVVVFKILRLFTLDFTVRNVCNPLKIISLTPFVFSKSVDIHDSSLSNGLSRKKHDLSPCYEYFCCEHVLKSINLIIDKDSFTNKNVKKVFRFRSSSIDFILNIGQSFVYYIYSCFEGFEPFHFSFLWHVTYVTFRKW